MPFVDHDIIYDEKFFLESIDPPARLSAPAISRSIIEAFSPSTVIDVGCGTGALLMELKSLGATVSGLEYSRVGLEMCQSRGLDVHRFDLESDEIPAGLGHFDVLISMEVAEHLPETLADRYVELICSLSDTVVFTAAVPGQGGRDHVNEQPHDYWISKFEARGYRHDDQLSNDWRENWKAEGVVLWYYQNIMVFTREART